MTVSRHASRVQTSRTGTGRNACRERETTWLRESSQFVTIRGHGVVKKKETPHRLTPQRPQGLSVEASSVSTRFALHDPTPCVCAPIVSN